MHQTAKGIFDKLIKYHWKFCKESLCAAGGRAGPAFEAFVRPLYMMMIYYSIGLVTETVFYQETLDDAHVT